MQYSSPVALYVLSILAVRFWLLIDEIHASSVEAEPAKPQNQYAETCYGGIISTDLSHFTIPGETRWLCSRADNMSTQHCGDASNEMHNSGAGEIDNIVSI
jgi:hypothetical protein